MAIPTNYPGRSGGAKTFAGLNDTPSTYSGQTGKFPKVNAAEDGLEFAAIAGGGDMLGANNLSDVANAATSLSNIGGASQTDLTALEDKVIYYEIFEVISSTSGTATKPPDSTIILNRYEAAGDCLIVEIDSNSRPLDEVARESDGTIVTSTFDVSGNYSLSGTPDSASYAIIYQISIKLVDSGNVSLSQIVNSFEIYDADKLPYDNTSSGMAAVNVQDAIDELDTDKAPTAHNHAASNITSGLLAHERGGVEADISGYTGLIYIEGGATYEKPFGIADGNAVKIDEGSVAEYDFARFSTSGLEGRSVSETKTDLVLNNVDNTSDATKNAASVTLTNKTIDADNNTLSNIVIGAECTGASTALTDTADITYNADTDVSGNGWVLDEDDLSSDSATKVPTQQSVKAYVDNNTIGDVVDDTTPQLGGDLDLNSKNLDFGAILTSNGTYQGIIKSVTVDTNTNGAGSPLAQAADFHFDDADADAESTAGVVVLALESGTGTKKVMLKGEYCDTSWTWTAGYIYLSTTAGTLTQTAPSATDDVVQIMGWALSADTIWFEPQLVYVKHA